MNLNILFTGQSNAAFYSITDGQVLANLVAQQLGYSPGFGDTVTVIGGSVVVGGQEVDATTVPSIALQQPITPGAQGFLAGGPGTYELSDRGQRVVQYLQSLPAAVRSSPTVIVWMHNESDSTFPGLTAAAWVSALSYYVSQLRGTGLGQGAGTTPLVFVNVPFHSDEPSLFASSQVIRDGMQQLIDTPSFNAIQGPQTAMFDMSGSLDGPLDPNQTAPGGPHMSAADKRVLDASLAPVIAQVVAQRLSSYAVPGSAAATDAGRLLAPTGWVANTVAGQPNQIIVEICGARGGLDPLGSGAAAGLGWSAGTSGQNRAASTQVLGSFDNGDASLLLTFGAAVAVGQKLYYGYADSRLSASPTGAAEGDQIEDRCGGALLLPDNGLTVGQVSDALPATVAAFGTTLAGAAVATSGGTVLVNAQLVATGVDTLQFADGQLGLAGSEASLIDRLYQAVLGRHADPAGLLADLRSNLPAVDLAAGMLSSPEYSAEYVGTHGVPSGADFVDEIYRGGVGRMPTGLDLQACLSALQGGMSRASTAASIASSPEAQSLQRALGYAMRLPDQHGAVPVPQQAEIVRLYEGLLGRDPVGADVQAWSGAIAAGAGMSQVAGGFLGSAEYQQAHADPAYVTTLYDGFLGRDPDASGLSSWDGSLGGGTSQAQVAVDLDNAPEAQAHAASLTAGQDQEHAFITRLYLGLLGRDPSAPEVDSWAGKIQSGATETMAAQAFLSSAEYRAIDNARFLTFLYDGILSRVPDQAGLAALTGLLDGGASRADLVVLVSDSAEAQARWTAQVARLTTPAAGAFYLPGSAGATEGITIPAR